MTGRRTRFLVTAAITLLVVVAGVGSAEARPRPPVIKDGSEIEVQILALNDFHGNLLPPTGSSGRVGPTTVAGGAAYLATHVKNLEATNANTVVVSAGDLIGASPLLSALFHDEPTIEAMNEIGLDINAVGNHEFDEGAAELLRMDRGGCHPTDGCQDGTPFRGAKFDFLAANVVDARGKTLFAPYDIRNFNGAKVAFIGMTLEGTPLIVSAAGIQGLEFRDEAQTVNDLVPQLRKKGIEAIVVLVHEGGSPTALNINGCSGVSGPIVDIVNNLDPAVDLVVSGHTHQPYNCVIDGIPTTSAYSFGRLITDIDMRVDRKTNDVTGLTINNKIITRDVPEDQEIVDLIDRYNVVATPIANRPIGRITGDLPNAGQPDGEQAMGNVIADAQLAATDGPAPEGEAVVAFMNPGGVRGGLTYASSTAGEGAGVVTFGEAFTVQPFGNILQTLSLTGAQIDALLEQQFCGVNSPSATPAGFFKVLLPSDGFAYTWDNAIATSPANVSCATDPALGAVNPASITVDGVVIDLNASYRVTVNNFLADGGDGFFILREGTNRVGGLEDLQAFEAYLQAAEPAGIDPPALDRVTRIN